MDVDRPGVPRALEAVDAHGVHTQGLGLERVPDRDGLVHDLHPGLLERGQVRRRVAAGGFRDLDAGVDDHRAVVVVGHRIDGRKDGEVDAERLVGEIAAALDLLGERVRRRLSQRAEEPQRAGVRDGRDQLRGTDGEHSAADDGMGTGPAPVPPPANGRERAEAVSAQERREQILEAATVLIARRGYHNVRVADIARYCGTSTATVHYHFPSKEATLHAALEFYAHRFRAQIDVEFEKATSARDKLRRLIEVQLPFTSDDIDEWSVWIQFWNQAMLEPRLRDTQRRVYSGWYQVVLDLLRECQAEGLAPGADVEALADRFTAMVDGLAIQILANSTDMQPDRMRALLLRAFEPYLELG